MPQQCDILALGLLTATVLCTPGPVSERQHRGPGEAAYKAHAVARLEAAASSARQGHRFDLWQPRHVGSQGGHAVAKLRQQPDRSGTVT
jgi:hypothetical protein